MNLERKNGVATTYSRITSTALAGDIVSTMADYTAESKFLTPEGILRGPEAIRSLVRQAGDILRDAPPGRRGTKARSADTNPRPRR